MGDVGEGGSYVCMTVPGALQSSWTLSRPVPAGEQDVKLVLPAVHAKLHPGSEQRDLSPPPPPAPGETGSDGARRACHQTGQRINKRRGILMVPSSVTCTSA